MGKENGDSEKEDFLREFGESLRNFIKTGVENKQLEKLVAVKEKFQETFEKRFRIEEILVEISEISVKKTLELVKEKNSALENHGAVPSDGSEMLNCVSEEASKIISIELKNLLEKGVQIIENNVKIQENESFYTIQGQVAAQEMIAAEQPITDMEQPVPVDSKDDEETNKAR